MSVFTGRVSGVTRRCTLMLPLVGIAVIARRTRMLPCVRTIVMRNPGWCARRDRKALHEDVYVCSLGAW